MRSRSRRECCGVVVDVLEHVEHGDHRAGCDRLRHGRTRRPHRSGRPGAPVARATSPRSGTPAAGDGPPTRRRAARLQHRCRAPLWHRASSPRARPARSGLGANTWPGRHERSRAADARGATPGQRPSVGEPIRGSRRRPVQASRSTAAAATTRRSPARSSEPDCWGQLIDAGWPVDPGAARPRSRSPASGGGAALAQVEHPEDDEDHHRAGGDEGDRWRRYRRCGRSSTRRRSTAAVPAASHP